MSKGQSLTQGERIGYSGVSDITFKILNENDKPQLLSKFLVGTSEDAVIPIPVFIDVQTGKILTELLPKELREEYEEYNNEK